MLNFLFLVFVGLNFAQDMPEAVKRLQAFTGRWEGPVTMEYSGKPIIKMTGFQNCQTVAEGWAVQCVGQFKGDKLVFNEAIQLSYDQASDKIVLAVIYSLGPQSFSVTGNWNKSDLILSRKFEMKGLAFEEIGSWKFLNKHVRDLEINSTLGGKFFGRITGHLEKR